MVAPLDERDGAAASRAVPAEPPSDASTRRGTGVVLSLDHGCGDIRRRLGPLVWSAFEDLALRAEPDGRGWVTFGGVRDLGRSLGVTKDTAARAVAHLVDAGIVARERVVGPSAARRSAYRLAPPAGTALCRSDQDSWLRPARSDTASRPTERDNNLRPTEQDINPCLTEPDVATRPDDSDSALCPQPSDNSVSPDDRAGRQHAVAASGPQLGSVPLVGAVTDADAVVSSLHRGGIRALPDDEFTSDAMVTVPLTALSERVGSAWVATRRGSRRQTRVAHNEAQGQLFDLAVTVEAQDQS